MFELVNEYNQNAVIKVIGVGGGGGNAVMSMLESKIHGAEFILANTDSQALRDIKGATMIQIGSEITKGLGAGADPEKGREAALEAKEELSSAIEGADMLFIAAGMGGGTGTGAASVIAQIARDAGILTVAVVTKPYEFEGSKRMLHAEKGIEALSEWVDSLIVIPNEKLAEVYGDDNSIFSSFENANDVLRGAVKGIAEIITIRGFINVDFADVKTVMSGRGKAMMGSGFATGEERADKAVQAAIDSPLLDNIDLRGASGVLVNKTAGEYPVPRAPSDSQYARNSPRTSARSLSLTYTSPRTRMFGTNPSATMSLVGDASVMKAASSSYERAETSVMIRGRARETRGNVARVRRWRSR